MALVKKSTLGSRVKLAAVKIPATNDLPTPPAKKRAPIPPQAARRPTNAVERMDQATQELASGIGQASAAAAELQRSMDQISSGAEEAAGASQESLGLIAALNNGFRDA